MTNPSSSPAHTAGPWYFDPVELVVYDGQEKTSKAVAIIAQREEPSDVSGETSANGWMVAAAPELLAALEAMTATLGGAEYRQEHDFLKTHPYPPEQCALCLARTTIAKARGV